MNLLEIWICHDVEGYMLSEKMDEKFHVNSPIESFDLI